MSNNGKDGSGQNGDEANGEEFNFEIARRGGFTAKELPHPENSCFGCLAVGLGALLALILASYIFWRYNPEFHPETAGPRMRPEATATPKSATKP